ncbi:MAG: dihydrofolate reductase family protein [Firmicutes bacterium]|nr:dihydrofolate reductase family protein [Bacillota bacterium]
MMRKIILNLAISLDGYISDNDGGFDWIVGHGDNSNDSKEPFDFPKFLEEVDTLVMGSVCYEDVILSGLETFKDKKIIVATNREMEKRDNVEFISGDICSQVLELAKEEGRNIWLFGGAGLTDTFIKNNAVDEYIVAIIPTILGDGRRLFRGGYPKIDLHLESTSNSDGVVVMRYVRR